MDDIYRDSHNYDRIAQRRERIRRKIVRLIFIVYWLLIFEGALRKWALPSLDKIIFFIRDPFVLWIYWLAFRNRMWPKKNEVFSFGMSLGVIFLFLIPLQAMVSNMPFSSLAYGWRNYFFYLPLAFIIGEQFRGEDLKRLAKQSLLVAIPVAAIVYKQFHSPPDAFINKSIGEVVYTDAGFAGGSVVRVTGTFTFFHGYQLFVGSIFAFLLAGWVLTEKTRPLKGKFLYLSSIAAIVMLSSDITRGTFFLVGFVTLASIASGFFMRREKLRFRAIMLPVLLVFTAGILLSYVFIAGQQVRMDRFKKAEVTEGSVINRALTTFSMFVIYLWDVPVTGEGLGIFSRGGSVISTGRESAYSGGEENEWAKIIMESGLILGLLYIFLRILLVRWLFFNAIKATKRSNNPLPLLLIGYIGAVLLAWYTTTIGTVNGYGWLFAGFCIAANHLGERLSPDGEAGPWA